MNPQSAEFFKNNPKAKTSDGKTLEKLNENLSLSNIKPKSDAKYDKPLVSARTMVLKEAGKKLMETGEVTRIAAVDLNKK